MAMAKTARVMSTERFGPETLLLELWAAEPLGFLGGQYIILDSRIILRDGKAVKRAYSLLTEDTEQRRFQLAVKHIPGGFGSSFVHGLVAGTEISFSGPWGKFVLPEGTLGPILMLATDTGITAALGFVQATRYAPLVSQTVLIWLRTSAEYFLPDTFVRQRVPLGCGEVRIEPIPAVGHPERILHARAILHQILTRQKFAQAFLSGDGAVNRVLAEDLAVVGVPMGNANVESFFNMEKKSS